MQTLLLGKKVKINFPLPSKRKRRGPPHARQEPEKDLELNFGGKIATIVSIWGSNANVKYQLLFDCGTLLIVLDSSVFKVLEESDAC